MSAIFAFCSEIQNTNDICPILLRDRIKSTHPQLNNVFLNRSRKYNCITITGKVNHVLAAKADLKKIQPIEVTLLLHTLYPGLAYRKLARLKLHEELKQIALKQDIRIIVDYNDLLIKLVGSVYNVELARIDILLYFDHLLGLIANTIKIPLYVLNMIPEINSIMENTGTNIYLPSPYSNNEDEFIHVTGDTSDDVQRATTLLKKLLSQKIKLACRSQSILNAQKMDWILLYKRKELKKIMQDNGSFIMFGSEGTNQQIQVYAGNKINVERTLRSLNYLTSQIFQVVIYVNTLQSTDLVTLLSQESGALVIYRADSNQFVIVGSKDQIQRVNQIIRGLPLSQEQHQSVTFSIELAEDQKEFISGKKNGKINKIMKSCDANILFKPFNNYNFTISIESDDFFRAKDGLESLQQELPAELSFFVPEICHRRIIGVAGKNIQRVMKQYGVYVKFLSHAELQAYSGYLENQHNVVARTPEKNIESLQKLQSAVMEFITFQKDRDYITREEYVPYYTQRNMLHSNGQFLHDKGRLYNSRIVWPERNGSNHVLVTGPQSHIEEMQLRIQSLLPQYIELQIPASVVLEKLLKSSEIEDLQQMIYEKTKIFLILPENLILTESQIFEDHVLKIEGFISNVAISDVKVTFKLCFDINTKSRLTIAHQLFDKFMEERFVPVDKHNTLRSSPSIEYLRHISPSVLHHIDHPESYENTTAENLQKNTFQFTNKKVPKGGSQSPRTLDLFNRMTISTNENYNLWSNNSSSTFARQSDVYPSTTDNLEPKSSRSNSVTKSYYPQPKATFSTSSAQLGSVYNNNDRMFGSFPLHGIDPTPSQFPPVGYSRQRSISLIPTHHDQQTFQQNNLHSPVGQSFGYSLGLGSYEYYSGYNAFDSKTPSSSVSTPIPVHNRNNNDKKASYRKNDIN